MNTDISSVFLNFFYAADSGLLYKCSCQVINTVEMVVIEVKYQAHLEFRKWSKISERQY